MAENKTRTHSEIEDEILAEAMDGYHRVQYQPAFFNHDGAISAGFTEDYYATAQTITRRIVDGETPGKTEGAAAIFLFRHYLGGSGATIRLRRSVSPKRSTKIARNCATLLSNAARNHKIKSPAGQAGLAKIASRYATHQARSL